jgi:hypothetical protein
MERSDRQKVGRAGVLRSERQKIREADLCAISLQN